MTLQRDVTCRLAGTCRKTIELFPPAEKLAESAKRVIEAFTKLPIYEPRAFHRLSNRFLPNIEWRGINFFRY